MNNKIRIIAFSFCLAGIQPSFGQTGTLPPVSFPGGTSVCDPTSYKLVFYDGFDGTSLDHTKWNSYMSHEGMDRIVSGTTIHGDHDDWVEARLSNTNALFRDENVVVSGGTCKLYIKNEPYTWQCPTGCDTPSTRYITCGVISTPFNIVPHGGDNWYNSARIEAKIKHATFPGYWGTLWSWHGQGVNEIDVTEALGGGSSMSWPYLFSTRPKNTINFHAWEPRPNTLELPRVMSWGDVYPKQSWWDWMINRYHKQDDWHIYASEWDTACIKIFLDHELVTTLWKYYKKQNVLVKVGSTFMLYTVKVPSGCSPSSGTWYVTEGFPYNSNSHSHFRISNGMASGFAGDPGLNYTFGQTEVDYVKIWQRHPEGEHEEICNDPIPNIAGPSTLCGTTNTMYITMPGSTVGTWSISNSAVTIIGSSYGSSVTIKKNPLSSLPSTVLSFTYTPTGCPPVTISKTITMSGTGTSAFSVFCSRAWFPLNEHFSLFASPDVPGTTYNWEVWYGLSKTGTLKYYTGTGRYISTSSIFHHGNRSYYVKWKLTVTNLCGTQVFNGEKENVDPSYAPPMMSVASSFMLQDTSAFYLEARFSQNDSLAYEQKVTDRVANIFIDDINDSVEIANKIGQIRMEELEPYLYFSDVNNNPMMERKALPETQKADKTVLYPNPVHESIYVRFSGQFNAMDRVEYSIYNTLGQLLMDNSMSTQDEPINIKGLSKDVYFIKFKQGSVVESCKFVKE